MEEKTEENGTSKGKIVARFSVKQPAKFLGAFSSSPIASHIVAAICVICLLLVVSWIWVEMKERFPRLPYGSYWGTIKGVFPENEEQTTRFFVESLESDELFFAVIKPGWRHLPISAVRSDQSGEDGEWLYPIVIYGPGMRLKFIGSFNEDGGYSGEVKELSSGRKGAWRLDQIEARAKPAAVLASLNLDLWLRLKSEFEDVEKMIVSAGKKGAEQAEEIDRLTQFITDEDQAKLQSEKEFAERKQELADLKKVLAERRAEAQKLNQQVSISLQVTPMGKLVSLARETLERENRWAESMLRSALSDVDNEFEQNYEKAQKIMTVKREIALERDRIFLLERKAGKKSNVRDRPHSFDSYWRKEGEAYRYNQR